MNILYISIAFPKEDDGNNIYTDLAEKIAENNKITILATDANIDKTIIKKERNIDVLRVKIGGIFNVGLIKKAISFITLQFKLKKAIKKYLRNEKFDLILFMAPPVTIGSVVKYAMKKFNAKSYLMQKDIFPQNAIDLGMLKKWNPAYWYFKYKEKQMYKTATKIGCMSNGNIDYLQKNNPYLKKEKFELFPNTVTLNNTTKTMENNIRKKYNIPKDKVLAVYGGNFGKPQGINFILEVLEEYKNNDKVFFLLSGRGTEKNKIENHVKSSNMKNVKVQDFISLNDYNAILQETDVGLVFLDYRFTIPNIPSRTLTYMENKVPIMAATDKNTDYKEILIKQAKAGLWAESNNIEEFKKQFDYLIDNKDKRKKIGENGRKFLEENWTTLNSIKILENTYKKMKGE